MNKKGFTLLEVIIYIALFAILIGGGLFTAYSLIESNARSQSMFIVYDEGNFLLSKINWAISGTSAIGNPAQGVPGSVLEVTKIDGTEISISGIGDDLTITYDDADPIVLNNSNIRISNVLFDHQIASASEFIRTSMTITAVTDDGKSFSQDFSATKYLRK